MLNSWIRVDPKCEKCTHNIKKYKKLDSLFLQVEVVCGGAYRIIWPTETVLCALLCCVQYLLGEETGTLNSVHYSHLFHRRDLSQDVTPLAAPDHQANHGQGEENGDKDEDGERVIRGIDPHLLLYGAVGKKVLVYADDVALHQRIGPVAVDNVGLGLCAEGEEVVLTDEVCEVAPVLGIYVSHVLLKVLSTDFHLPLQAGLIADFPHSGSGLCAETVRSWQSSYRHDTDQNPDNKKFQHCELIYIHHAGRFQSHLKESSAAAPWKCTFEAIHNWNYPKKREFRHAVRAASEGGFFFSSLGGGGVCGGY